MTPSRPAVIVPIFAVLARAGFPAPVCILWRAGSAGRRAAGQWREPDRQVVALHPKLFLLVLAEIHRKDDTGAAGPAPGDFEIARIRVSRLRTPILHEGIERVPSAIALGSHPQGVRSVVIMGLEQIEEVLDLPLLA